MHHLKLCTQVLNWEKSETVFFRPANYRKRGSIKGVTCFKMAGNYKYVSISSTNTSKHTTFFCAVLKAKSIAAVFETERTPVRDGERCKKDRTDDCTDQCKQTEVLTLCY